MHSVSAKILTLILFALGLALSLPNLGRFHSLVMDEAQYIPAVQTYLKKDLQGYSNPRNPPLGKEIIALSMECFGDNYFAYRFPSALAWAGVTGLIFCGVYNLCRSQIAGLMASGLWLTSTLAWIHGRLATLDMMTCFFLLAGAVCFFQVLAKPLSPKRAWWLWLSLGLASLGGAVKALDFILIPWVLVGLVAIRKEWPLRNSLKHALPACLLLPTGILFLSYLIFGTHVSDIPGQFALMVRLQSLPHHEFSGLSPWYDWFLLKGNLSYYSSPLPDGFRYRIWCANNPVLWVGGSFACVALLVLAWRRLEVGFFLVAL